MTRFECGEQILVDAFQRYSMQSIGQVGLLAGASAGLLAQHEIEPKLICGDVKEDTWLCFLTRYLIALTLIVPWYWFDELFKNSDLGTYADMFVCNFLPTFMIGFSAFCLADLINFQLGLFEMHYYDSQIYEELKDSDTDEDKINYSQSQHTLN